MSLGCVVGSSSVAAVRPAVTPVTPDNEGVYDAPWDVGKKPLGPAAFLSLHTEELQRSGTGRRSFDPVQRPPGVSDTKSSATQMGNSSPRIKSRRSEDSTTCGCATNPTRISCRHGHSSAKLQNLNSLQSQPPCGLAAQRLLQQQRCQSPLQLAHLTCSPKNSGNLQGAKAIVSSPDNTVVWKQRTKENEEEEAQGQYDVPWDLKNKMARGNISRQPSFGQQQPCCNGHSSGDSRVSPTHKPSQSTIAVQTDTALTKRLPKEKPSSSNSSPQPSSASDKSQTRVKQKKRAPLPPKKPHRSVVNKVDDGDVYDAPWDQNKQSQDLLKVLNRTKGTTTTVVANSALNSSFTSDSGHPSPTSSSLSSSGNSCVDSLPRSQPMSPVQRIERLSPCAPIPPNKPKLTATVNSSSSSQPVLETAFCCKSSAPTCTAATTVGSHHSRTSKWSEEERKERKIQQLCHGVVSDEEFGGEKLNSARRQRGSNPPRTQAAKDPCRTHSVSPVVMPKPIARQRKSMKETVANVQPSAQTVSSMAERKRLLGSGCNGVESVKTCDQQLENLNGTAGGPPSLQFEQTTAAEVYDAPWEFTATGAQLSQLAAAAEPKGVGLVKRSSPELLKSQTPDLSSMRAKLKLNLGCGALNPTADKIDIRVPIEKQTWFHGAISRSEAERILADTSEGAYLVRVCEGNKEEFALSLKSAKGFMHMKMQQNPESRWILGYFSQPFDDISTMIRYYSVNKLPIKGAEHMCLLKPINDQLL